MLKVGITGGIGSGKTLVCRIFSLLGIPVFDADTQAKELVNSDEKIIAQIKKEFGNSFYDAEGRLNRKHVARLVFSNKAALAQLNSIIHPAVIKQAQEWTKQFTDVPYSLTEAAILFESGMNTGLDKVITVTAPEELRIKRVMERDNKTRDEILSVIKTQSSDREKIKQSDFVIINDDKKMILQQVLSVHEKLLSGVQQ